MKIIKQIEALKEQRKVLEGKKIGFVPTMGYFHDGHLSLIDRSIEENDVNFVSIYVNPTQFGQNEDLDRYPRDFKRDKALLEQRVVDYVFFPDSKEMYGDDFYTHVEVEKLGTVLCGKSRPRHFKGVTTIVLKLFNIIRPTTAYFGQKDAQQAIIIKRMCRDLNLDIDIKVLPIKRDRDGLALSSRNEYLSQKERTAALLLSGALKKARNFIQEGWTNPVKLSEAIEKELQMSPLIEIDYVGVVNLEKLERIEKIDPNNTLIAAAIKVGSTRLIDNFILGEI